MSCRAFPFPRDDEEIEFKTNNAGKKQKACHFSKKQQV
jgi:hypothetical protein